MNATQMPLRKIAGFESTGYALLHGRLVWAGEDACSDHPRNVHRPWRAEALVCDGASLRAGAHQCLALLGGGQPSPLPSPGGRGSELSAPLAKKGLLRWLTNQPLPFPMDRAAPRFDAIRGALERNDLREFEAAALRVLGLGEGLTPSGDDFLGGICFALQHAPRKAWRAEFAEAIARIRAAAATSTNAISAALLDDLIAGSSYRAAHEFMAALQSNAPAEIGRAAGSLMGIGASSGADILAGVLLALLTTPDADTRS
jgi:Protein of unknown function (DUF2877)